MTTVAQPRSRTQRRNEGGRYTARSDWYAQHEAANLAAVEAQQTAITTRLAQVVGDAVTALPEAASRIARAAHIVQVKDVWPMTDGSFLVGAESDTERAYLVTRHPWGCDCKAAQHQEGPCKHQVAAMLTVKMGAAYQPTYQ